MSNRIAAAAAVARLPERPGLRILELGAGAGSGSLALLEALADRGRVGDVAEYRLTEPSAFFRRRGERSIREAHPGLPLVSAAIDIDRPLAEQGVEPGTFDLVFAVNVLHVARRLAFSLGEIRAALAPGGLLVAGEAFRLLPDQAIPAELVFQLFRSFAAVEVDARLRPVHGFLSPEQWQRALAASGFAPVEIVPDLVAIRPLYPRFFAGALRARASDGAAEPTHPD